MLYMTVWAIKHRTFVNNFAYETAEINIEVKHLQGNKRAFKAPFVAHLAKCRLFFKQNVVKISSYYSKIL